MVVEECGKDGLNDQQDNVDLIQCDPVVRNSIVTSTQCKLFFFTALDLIDNLLT